MVDASDRAVTRERRYVFVFCFVWFSSRFSYHFPSCLVWLGLVWFCCRPVLFLFIMLRVRANCFLVRFLFLFCFFYLVSFLYVVLRT